MAILGSINPIMTAGWQGDAGWGIDAYVKRGGITFDAIEVQGIQSMDNGKAVVSVRQRYSLPLLRLPNQQATLQDQWRLIDGQWYHYQPLSVAFPDALPREGSQQSP